MRRRWLPLIALIFAGEAIFALPFVLPRVFRPTMLEVLGISNLQLGTAYSAYGLVALGAYLCGGPLADRYPPRGLMVTALLLTAAGGLLLWAAPSYPLLLALYAAWGLSSILLFWSALLRATREWGGPDQQGRAYGFLDGGRGLLAATLASAAVGVFALTLGGAAAEITSAQRQQAYQSVLLLGVACTAFAALLVWLWLPATRTRPAQRVHWARLAEVARMPRVWLQGLIVLCAYMAYKATDLFSLYAHDVLGYDDASAAGVGSLSFWLRPVAAIAAGLLADRWRASSVSIAAFMLVALGMGALALANEWPAMALMLLLLIGTASLGVYALRGVYFALTAEARVPLALTGTAVGLVSVLGFTPDVFSGPLYGYLLDRAPGAPGHQQVFGLVALVALVGALGSAVFGRMSASQRRG